MQIPDDLIPGLPTVTGPVLIYFFKGRPERGYALRKGEFVTSIPALNEALKKAGFPALEAERV
ncbi:hypothetical protein DEO48_00735 [Enterobacter sp. CGMCC 5087]|uniref:hypothetical protein n=1 Tax=Enterobacter TaxID=547 RepID=UPI000D683C21|nr:hypothetical protein [Enterobacter sp. CGMCC 5087]PWI82115.1 hypothetical protein DEO48_00735 [Enterobacter sp. CGMCC 5087]